MRTLNMKPLSLALGIGLLASSAWAAKVSIEDNKDIILNLSQNNYNRIFIENDRIAEAVFPESAMGLQKDETDGSLYVMPSSDKPFTLFFSTDTGRHFSVTVQGEEALGKTFELVMPTIAVKAAPANVASKSPKKQQPAKQIPADTFNSKAPLALVDHMSANKPLTGYTVKKQFGIAERWQQGLSLFPRARWQGKDYLGEVIELYNGSSKPLKLAEDWFDDGRVRAMMLTGKTIEPKGRVMLYRVKVV